jgi:hypothetical protein
MTDDRLFELLDAMRGAPSYVEGTGRRMWTHAPGFGIVEQRRLGKGQRWSFAPSRDVVPPALYAYGLMGPRSWSRPLLEWARRAELLNVAAHAQAMSVRCL